MKTAIFLALLLLCAASCKPQDVPEKDDSDPQLPVANSSPNYAAIKQLFTSKCSSCHSSNETLFRIPFESAEALIESGYIAPFDQENSLILAKIKTGHGDLNDLEIKTIVNWVDWSIGLARETHLAQNLKTSQDAVKADLEKHDMEARKFLRYISLHEFVSRSPKRIDTSTAVKGIVKAINLLSQSESIVDPVVIDKERGIVRVNLQAVQWPVSEWERLTRDYPYKEENKVFAELCSTCGVALVRAGWFLNNALRAPTYYRLAGIPRQIDLFEEHVGVKFVKNAAEGGVVRAGFLNSGVSEHNRVIERYQDAPRFVWRSYEFNSNNNSENVLENPLGPGSGVTGTYAFNHKGSEFIYQRKNGFLGFYAVATGQDAVNETPNITVNGVSTPVSVGLTCLQCHKSLIFRRDEVRDAIQTKGGLPPNMVSNILSLYPTYDVMAEKMAADNESQGAALAKIGLTLDTRDPIFDILDAYNKVDFNLLAHEIGAPLFQVVSKVYALQAQAIPALTPAEAKSSVKSLSQATTSSPINETILKNLIRNAIRKGNDMPRDELDEIMLFQPELLKSEMKQ